jgi:7,8-dihydropterin-6-yl-methyl-4-(beta-D-ribofuranosyl)aminobenzene 5'-phosphate synthase
MLCCAIFMSGAQATFPRGLIMTHKLNLALIVGVVVCLCMTAAAMPPRSHSPNGEGMAAADTHAEVKALKITILSTMLADDGIGEWGFSALVESDGHKILFDTGARPNTVLDNAKELKIDLSDVQDVILSHFHDDHTAGLMTLRTDLSKKNPAALSRVHVAKGIFLERRAKGGSPQGAIGAENPMIAMKKEFEKTGGKFIEHDKVDEIFPGIWLTGPVPRVFPEKNYAASIEVKEDGSWVEDNVPDDQSLVFNTNQGFVLLAGCGHSGIINTLTYARKEIRPAPVDAAIGGFHLFNASDATLDWTADKLKEFQTAQLMGAHCTGIESVYHLRQKMGLNRHNCVVGTVGATFDLKDGIKTGRIAR